ncbi:MAG: hypothetical protein RIQ60_1815 [Pseudomonadota bacterium]
MQLAKTLAATHPRSGYSETLFAEAASTWSLSEDGEPSDLRKEIVALCDSAIKFDPRLAHAHVAKARALLRSSDYRQARASIDAALAIDQNLSGALFLRGEIHRRIGTPIDAETWYLKFIESTPSSSRKSNGYHAIGRAYQDAALSGAANGKAYTAKARDAYETMLRLEPKGAWRNVNFAIFLNDYVADFDAAELYSRRALAEMEFPMARFNLAAAGYQKLWVQSRRMSTKEVRDALKLTGEATRVTLREAIAFRPFSPVVRARLLELQSRVEK